MAKAYLYAIMADVSGIAVWPSCRRERNRGGEGLALKAAVDDDTIENLDLKRCVVLRIGNISPSIPSDLLSA